jgi:hypothetical protein
MVYRLAAATFGWPMMIRDQHSIPLPVLGDDDLSPDDDNPTSIKLVTSLRIFTYTCELLDIIGDILSTLYCNNGAVLSTRKHTLHAPTLSKSMALNGRLEAFLLTLPDFLRTFVEGSQQTNYGSLSGSTRTIQQAISCRCDYIYPNPVIMSC